MWVFSFYSLPPSLPPSLSPTLTLYSLLLQQQNAVPAISVLDLVCSSRSWQVSSPCPHITSCIMSGLPTCPCFLSVPPTHLGSSRRFIGGGMVMEAGLCRDKLQSSWRGCHWLLDIVWLGELCNSLSTQNNCWSNEAAVVKYWCFPHTKAIQNLNV